VTTQHCPRCATELRSLRPAQTAPHFDDDDPLLTFSGIVNRHFRCLSCGNIVALQDAALSVDRRRLRQTRWARRD
jgi:hypothetical protein